MVLTQATKLRLNKIYTDPNDAGSFGGVLRLWSSAKKQLANLSYGDVAEFLKGQETYTLHRPIRKRYPRNRVVVSRIDQQWEADLVDMQEFAMDNGGVRYLLTVIDVLSKYAWVVPVKFKDAESVRAAFVAIFKKAGARKPERLHTDKGKEFFNAKVQELLRKEKVTHFATESDTKASIAERFNRTLKNRMWSYFHSKHTHKWVDIVDKLVMGYNLARHRSIGMAPAKVRKENELVVWRRLYGYGRHKPGGFVRLSKQRQVFEKGYLPGWSEEVFKVVKEERQQPRPIYRIQDMLGEDIKGSFYQEELQSINYDPNALVKIEKVLRKRKHLGKTQIFVKWQGRPTKFNSWVNQDEVKQF